MAFSRIGGSCTVMLSSSVMDAGYEVAMTDADCAGVQLSYRQELGPLARPTSLGEEGRSQSAVPFS
jgi:hypothetical protein